MYRWYNTITLTMNTTKYISTDMYLVVFMVSVMVLYHLYIYVSGVHG
jgi:hypothetical protein